MFRRLELTNYGPFVRAVLDMGPLTVVVGPNASGKSKLLEALHFIGSQRESVAVSRFLKTMRRRGADQQSTSIGLEADNGLWVTWKAEVESGPVVDARFVGLVSERPKLRTKFLRLRPDVLRSPSYIDSDEPLMREDGYGLATTLAYLKLNEGGSFDRLLQQTREVVPTFENLRFKRARVPQSNGGEVFGDELVFDMKGAKDLPPDAASDGTLLTLGILACTMESSRRYASEASSVLFLVDDVEHGLHPRAQGELVTQLRGLTKTSGARMLATSHSPYFLDALRPEEVRLTGFLEDGSVAIRALTDHPDFERWKGEMTPGEMWSLVGEDWIR